MAFPTTTGKVHYRSLAPQAMGSLLFCSGMSVSGALHTRSFDEITCRSCRRKLVRKAKRSLGSVT